MLDSDTGAKETPNTPDLEVREALSQYTEADWRFIAI